MEEGPRGAGQRSPKDTFQCLSGVTPATVKEIGILSSSDKQHRLTGQVRLENGSIGDEENGKEPASNAGLLNWAHTRRWTE